MKGRSEETGFRYSSGHYQLKFFPDKPTKEALERAKKGGKLRFSFTCAACEQTWFPGSTAAHIKRTGLCEFCERALKDKSYNVVSRCPTLEEVLERWEKIRQTGGELTHVEAAILVKAMRK